VLDGARDKGEIDIVSRVSSHLPMMVIRRCSGSDGDARKAAPVSDAIPIAPKPTKRATSATRPSRRWAPHALLMQIVDENVAQPGRRHRVACLPHVDECADDDATDVER